MEGGYRKGRLQVHHKGETKLLDFTEESHKKFYYSVFYSDCQYGFGKIQEGRRLTMSFELIRNGPITFPVARQQLPMFQNATQQMRELLTGWNVPDKNSNTQRLLAIPLHHKYSEKNLTFSGLRGTDCWIHKLFQSTELLDIHLSIITKYQRGVPDEDDLTFLDYFDDEEEETYTSHPWVDGDDSIALFGNLNINVDSELLDEEKLVFSEDSSPDRQEFTEGGEDAEYDPPILELWFEQPVMVIWPKSRTANIWKTHMPTTSDVREFVSSEEPARFSMPIDALRKVLKTFRNNPRHLHVVDSRNRIVCRLGELCAELDARDEALELLHILADDHRSVFNKDNFAKERGNDIFARTVSKFIQNNQWDPIVDFFKRLPDPLQSLNYVVDLVNTLLQMDLKNSAFTLVAQMNSVLRSVGDVSFQSLVPEPVATYVMLLVRLETEFEEFREQKTVECLASRIKTMDVERLCRVLIEIHQDHGLNLKSIPSGIQLIHDLCSEIVHKDLYSPTCSVKNVIVRVMECYLWLDDSALLRQLTNAVCVRSIQVLPSNNFILEVLLASDPLHRALQSSAHGKYTLTVLLIARIIELSRLKRHLEKHRIYETEFVKINVIFVKMLRSIIALEDSCILADVTRLILTAPIAGNNILLQTTVYSGEVRDDLMATDEGKRLLKTFVKARIDELSLKKQPVFSWEQPNATFHPDHQIVQEFLASSREVLIYSNFKNVTQANAFVRNNFGPFMISRNYSATSSVSKLKNRLSCKITKTDGLYLHQMGKFQLYQRELAHLRKLNIVPADSQTNLAAADVNKPPPAKRPKVETEEPSMGSV